MANLVQFLNTLQEDVDVMIVTNSTRKYQLDEEHSFEMADGVGNYRASNWLAGLEVVGDFEVLKVEYEVVCDRPQYNVTLNCPKSERTELLYTTTNSLALIRSLLWPID